MEAQLVTPDLRVYDGFLNNPDSVRNRGIRAKYTNYSAPDGEIYKRVAPGAIEEVVDGLNEAMGRPISLLMMGYRLNYAGEKPNKAIHADTGWGTYASVLFLNEPPSGRTSGTAFWEHHTGHSRIRDGELNVLKDVVADYDNAAAWEQTAFVNAKYNRCLIYRSELFHSRWPFEAFGSSPDDGRLIVVSFFN